MSFISFKDVSKIYQMGEVQIKALDSENRALSQEIRLLQNDPKYVEKMVRQRLHYLRANEVLYLFDAHPQPGARSDDRKN